MNKVIAFAALGVLLSVPVAQAADLDALMKSIFNGHGTYHGAVAGYIEAAAAAPAQHDPRTDANGYGPQFSPDGADNTGSVTFYCDTTECHTVCFRYCPGDFKGAPVISDNQWQAGPVN